MTKERVYVKVSSDFDSTGYMQPTSITWSDGRTFPIETVRDFRPAGTADNGCKCQYKNVGFISYKRVGKPTCLYDIF